MNIAYFRKSKYSLDKTIDNIIQKAKEDGWKILGEADLPDKIGKMILICRPEWIKMIIAENHNLLGFLPCAISVFQKDKNVLAGTGQPAVIKALAQNDKISQLASQAEVKIKDLINESAGVEESKPQKVRLYSTMTCPYCKMEQAWLERNKVNHEVIHVDLNQQAAEEMVKKTGQMGVPVTEIQYEDMEPEYIIGFDKPKLAQILDVRE